MGWLPPPDDLPRRLPAGTWIRGLSGPLNTYRESVLGKDGFYSGGEGSAWLRFGPERVIWEAMTPAGRARVERVCREFFACAECSPGPPPDEAPKGGAPPAQGEPKKARLERQALETLRAPLREPPSPR